MDYEKKYNEALKRAEAAIDVAADRELVKGVASTIFPELRESEDERIRKELKEAFEAYDIESMWNGIPIRSIFDWLERRKEQNLIMANSPQLKEQQPVMIQWTGKNLKEVIDFTGKSPKFGEWFKSWEDFENYVRSHDDILKLFCEDGSHYEVPVGAWIIKTPDGYNIPSRFRFIQKSAESKVDVKILKDIDLALRGLYDVLQPKNERSEEQIGSSGMSGPEEIGDWRGDDGVCKKRKDLALTAAEVGCVVSLDAQLQPECPDREQRHQRIAEIINQDRKEDRI